ncbi:MAG TPA: hypothetical protein VGP90_13905, partial [Acidimicrobiia bacterium]|nr:hypothetical protein [Acidimicrobiia bacterium]
MTGDDELAAARALKDATTPSGRVAAGAAGARLAEASAALVDGVRRTLPPWAERSADGLLAAWGRLEPDRRREVAEKARAAGEAAAGRVAAELGELLALDPAEQRATPLEIIRTAVREPTAVLAAAGLPDVVRDPFDERAWPDDRFGLVPRTLRDLDADLAAVHFAWGVAKAAVLRARAAGPS